MTLRLWCGDTSGSARDLAARLTNDSGHHPELTGNQQDALVDFFSAVADRAMRRSGRDMAAKTTSVPSATAIETAPRPGVRSDTQSIALAGVFDSLMNDKVPRAIETTFEELATELFQGRGEGRSPLLLLGAGASIESGGPGGFQLMRRVLEEHTPAPEVIKQVLELAGAKEELLKGLDMKSPGFQALMERYDELKKQGDSKGLDPIVRRLYDETVARKGPQLIYPMFAKHLQHHRPSLGYVRFAELAKEHYFRWILTTNFDPLIEESLYNARTPNYDVYVMSRIANDPDFLAEFIQSDFRFPPINVFKIHGDLKTRWIDANSESIQSFHGREASLKAALIDLFSRKSVWIVGHSLSDPAINEIILRAYTKMLRSEAGRPETFTILTGSGLVDAIGKPENANPMYGLIELAHVAAGTGSLRVVRATALDKAHKMNDNVCITFDDAFVNLRRIVLQRRNEDVQRRRGHRTILDFHQVYQVLGMTPNKHQLLHCIVGPPHVEPEIQAKAAELGGTLHPTVRAAFQDNVAPIYLDSMRDASTLSLLEQAFERRRARPRLLQFASDFPFVSNVYLESVYLFENPKCGFAAGAQGGGCFEAVRDALFREIKAELDKGIDSIGKSVSAATAKMGADGALEFRRRLLLKWRGGLAKWRRREVARSGVDNGQSEPEEDKGAKPRAPEELVPKGVRGLSRILFHAVEALRRSSGRSNDILRIWCDPEIGDPVTERLLEEQRYNASGEATQGERISRILETLILLAGHPDRTRLVKEPKDAHIWISIDPSLDISRIKLTGEEYQQIRTSPKQMRVHLERFVPGLTNDVIVSQVLRFNTTESDSNGQAQAAGSVVSSKSDHAVDSDAAALLSRRRRSPFEDVDTLLLTTGGPEHNNVLELLIALHRWNLGKVVFSRSNAFDDRIDRLKTLSSVVLETESYVGGVARRVEQDMPQEVRAYRESMGSYILKFRVPTGDLRQLMYEQGGGDGVESTESRRSNQLGSMQVLSVVGLSAVGTILGMAYVLFGRDFSLKDEGNEHLSLPPLNALGGGGSAGFFGLSTADPRAEAFVSTYVRYLLDPAFKVSSNDRLESVPRASLDLIEALLEPVRPAFYEWMEKLGQQDLVEHSSNEIHAALWASVCEKYLRRPV